jgi:hypothetical protein
MSIKRADRSEPQSEQLTIWTLLERVSTDPLEANIIDLSNWIGSLDLESAGDALVTWGVSFRDRAIQLLDEWQLKSPLTLAELIEPHFDVSMFDDLVLGRMEWDLGDLVEAIEADYPAERQAAPEVASVSKDAALELADLQTALDIAHDEDVSARLDEWGEPMSLLELQESLQMPLVQVWLALLLNGMKSEQRGDFYQTEQVWMLP